MAGAASVLAVLALAAAGALSLAGCHDPLTQLVVVVSSDLGPALEQVRIEVGPDGAPSGARTVQAPLPFSFGVRARSGQEDERVRVSLTGLDAGGAELARTEALIPFVRGETRRVVLYLEQACAGRDCAELTCRAGACTDPAIPPGALEPIEPGGELEGLPPVPRADAGPLDAGPRDAGPEDAGADDAGPADAGADGGAPCTPACPPDETCEASECRCGARASCGEGFLCEEGACVPWPRSCEHVGRARGCDLVALPGGSFTMGDEEAAAEGATGAFPEQPAITVSPLTIDAYEVTVARFREFWRAGHPAPAAPVPYPGGRSVDASVVSEPTRTEDSAECNWSPEPGAREAHPVNCITWSTALAFCAWDGGRLPTEAEWEWAARGHSLGGLVSGRDFPWGNEVPDGATGERSCTRAQAFSCAGDDDGATREVGAFAAAAGVYDQTGNVAELTADHYDFYGVGAGMCWRQVPQTDPLCRLASGEVTVRGGAHGSSFTSYLMGATRAAVDPSGGLSGVGLRCVR